ncbi:hypothetical protein LJK88_19225 [Paenibacillus sp. P26]|nr:hypothetical protein LJK88_19225 [Paenibacillus sp. P26]
MKGWFSLPVFGGVVAAGLVLGFFLFQEGQTKQDAGQMLTSLGMFKDDKTSSASAGASAKSAADGNGAASTSAGGAGTPSGASEKRQGAMYGAADTNAPRTEAEEPKSGGVSASQAAPELEAAGQQHTGDEAPAEQAPKARKVEPSAADQPPQTVQPPASGAQEPVQPQADAQAPSAPAPAPHTMLAPSSGTSASAGSPPADAPAESRQARRPRRHLRRRGAPPHRRSRESSAHGDCRRTAGIPNGGGATPVQGRHLHGGGSRRPGEGE